MSGEESRTFLITTYEYTTVMGNLRVKCDDFFGGEVQPPIGEGSRMCGACLRSHVAGTSDKWGKSPDPL